MNYIQKNLMANERIAFSTKLNWTLYIKPVVIILIAIVLLIDSYHSINGFIIYSLGIILMVAGIFSAFVTYFKIKTFEFAVTNKRVLIKHGILRTQSFEIMLNKVEVIYVEQNFIDRIVNSGTIIIKGTVGSQTPLRNVDNPFQFRIAVNEQIENLSLAR
ncbi:PH domain-containing protein [Hanamia caeni]|uniref:PH domain-containing protein n=1 Tax=Hanamia caeni TaxID=2294116 RepID=A0A3M9NPZ5_9BACT|nr:PH domain-containing protein [Hanamia caeni]RNI39849.1 PH domain-containing protein [Hanamia caeni]